jgi:predicted SAM-dependent methyltransferase
MNKVLLGQPVEETFAGIENNQEETAQELTLEQLSRAVGENALLQTEVSRQMALKLVELRDEIRIARTEIGRLQGQIEHFVGGVCSALEISAIETSHRAEHVCVTRPPIVPRLLNTQKLLRMGAEIRLNVGCGSKPTPEYLNVDERELNGVDLIADARALPFKAGDLTEIYAAHVIEHFTDAELKETLLPSWHGLLKTGGVLRLTVPDAEAMIDAFQRGDLPFEHLRSVTYGGQDYLGNFHYTMFSRESLRAILRETGFNVAEYTDVGRANGLCLEMEIRVTKI